VRSWARRARRAEGEVAGRKGTAARRGEGVGTTSERVRKKKN
jgi:hypothetical protein